MRPLYSLGVFIEVEDEVCLARRIEREQLTEEIIGQLGSSQIKVTETAFAGVQIRFGEEDLTLSSDLAHTTFYRELGRVRQRQD